MHFHSFVLSVACPLSADRFNEGVVLFQVYFVRRTLLLLSVHAESVHGLLSNKGIQHLSFSNTNTAVFIEHTLVSFV